MTGHPDDDLLASWLAGQVGDRTAAWMAEHVEDCASCASRAGALDPLAEVWTLTYDPMPPSDLVSTVLARAVPPRRSGWSRVLPFVAGGALPFLALALASPDAGPWEELTTVLGNTMAPDAVTAMVLLAAGALAVAGAVAVARATALEPRL